MKTRLVCGVGVVDVSYVVQKKVRVAKGRGKGTQKLEWICPYYLKWRCMIDRCYSNKKLSSDPSYEGCSVVKEWLHLSNFIKWVDEQPNKDWRQKHLDKDLLVEGNKVYSPDTCVFLSKEVNLFLPNSRKTRGEYLLGVSRSNAKVKFLAQCCDPLKRNNCFIGHFDTELQAHKAWQAKKHEYACQLAELQEDSRVADALRQRYAPDKDWTNK